MVPPTMSCSFSLQKQTFLPKPEMNTTEITAIITSAAVTSHPWSNVTDTFNNTYAVEVLAFSATSCCLSILGGAVIFATFVALPEIRNFTRKLVICLTVADLITASAYLMSVIRYANIHKGYLMTDIKYALAVIKYMLTFIKERGRSRSPMASKRFPKKLHKIKVINI